MAILKHFYTINKGQSYPMHFSCDTAMHGVSVKFVGTTIPFLLIQTSIKKWKQNGPQSWKQLAPVTKNICSNKFPLQHFFLKGVSIHLKNSRKIQIQWLLCSYSNCNRNSYSNCSRNGYSNCSRNGYSHYGRSSYCYWDWSSYCQHDWCGYSFCGRNGYSYCS